MLRLRFGDGIPPSNKAALENGIADNPAHQLARADGIVIAGNDVLDYIRVAVGIHHRDHRQLQLIRLSHRDVLLFGVENEHCVGRPGQVSDAVEIAFQLRELPGYEKGLFLGHDIQLA